MKIGILAAMDKELRLIQPLLEGAQEAAVAGYPAWRGKIGKHEILLMKCGIGKVNAALVAQKMIDEYAPDVVINSGVAGGADGSMNVGSLLIADEVAYHDVWCGPGTEYGAADGFPQRLTTDRRIFEAAQRVLEPETRYGLICSGDKFITTKEEIAGIKTNFPDALACDMESAAIGQTCARNKTEFAIVRVVSDTPGEAENISQYQNFWSEAPVKTFAALRKILNQL